MCGGRGGRKAATSGSGYASAGALDEAPAAADVAGADERKKSVASDLNRTKLGAGATLLLRSAPGAARKGCGGGQHPMKAPRDGS